MNYRRYKIGKVTEKLFDNFIRAVFYLPRQLYSKSQGFKKWIDNVESKSYKKKQIKKLSQKIFYDLESQGECVVLCGTDYENEFGFDRQDRSYELLLSDEKWLTKNKLKYEKLLFSEYIEQYMPNRKYRVGDWNKNNLVFIIENPKFVKK